MANSGAPAAARLAQLAEGWKEESRVGTRVVPVVGSGLAIQAAIEAKGSREDDWNGLLTRVVESFQVPRQALKNLPRSFIQQWETIVRATALHGRGWQPFVAERDLQAEVKKHLNELEQRTAGYPLYGRFAGAGFRDIISLNFDRRLALSQGARKVHTAGKKSQAKGRSVGIHGKTLFRHSRFTNGDQSVRVWYPHGDSSLARSIKLGVRAYGLYIAEMDRLRNRYMKRWKEASEPYEARSGKEWVLPPDQWDSQVRLWPDLSWVDVFLSAPLVFIGCGLEPDEWPLWWLLHQRARNTTFLDQKPGPERPETVILTAEPSLPGHLVGSPAFLEVIHFPNYHLLWQAVGESLL